MHRKTIIHIFILLLALLAFHTGSALALSSSPADVYVPFSQNKTEWINTVCQHMTADGCSYFTAHESDPAWLALKEMDAAGAGINFKNKVTDLSEDLELWQLELTVFTSAEDTQAHDVYATVSTQNGKHQIDRMVMLDRMLTASGTSEE